MNIDKHDLFRNAIPGFVFIVVILSFYAISESLDTICASSGGGQVAVLSLVAGFPLGFIIHNLYRIVFFVWSGEQERLDKMEADFVKSDFGGNNREKGHFFMFQLSRSEYENWKHRIDFLYSYIHALGASVLAIALALIFMLIIKGCRTICCHSPNSDVALMFFTGIAWIAIGVIFYEGRKHVKQTVIISSQVFWQIYLKTKHRSTKRKPSEVQNE